MEHLVIRLDEAGDSVTLTVSGEVELANSTRLTRALDAILERDPVPALIRADMTAVEFMDTTGLSVLLGARVRAAALGSRFVVSSESPALNRLFAVTGVGALLHP